MLCIDTSGSMIGKREMVAKSVALYMANTAVSQKRACYLINFSTNVNSLDLTKIVKTFLNFLKNFNSGTDVQPALRHAMSS